MLIDTDQLLVHAVGDYILQSDWMANGKTKRWLPAFVHALVYSCGFLVFCPSLRAWLVIFGTHLLIDRFRLARYVVWAKNWIAPLTWWSHQKDGKWIGVSNQTASIWRHWIDYGDGELPAEFKETITMAKMQNLPFVECAATGYPPACPPWMAVWLLIIADNIMHIAINGAAIKWL